ncbi:FecR family protein [bacterium]|nr:FecR family protein [bacterium]
MTTFRTVLTIGVIFGWISSAEAKTVQLVEIQGEPQNQIKIERGGKEIQIKQADPIQVGDIVFAGEKQTLILEIDSQKGKTEPKERDLLTLSPGTQFEINPDAEKLGQSGTLREGGVKGGFHKVSSQVDQALKKKLRFTLRTRSAVMGVRGTEFVVNGAGSTGNFNFFTTQGTVEIAKSEHALIAGDSTQLAAGKMIEATPSGIGEAKVFQGKDLPDFAKGSNDSGSAAPSDKPEAKLEEKKELEQKPEEKKEEAKNEDPFFRLWNIDLGGRFMTITTIPSTNRTKLNGGEITLNPELKILSFGTPYLPKIYFRPGIGGFGVSNSPGQQDSTSGWIARGFVKVKYLFLYVEGGVIYEKWRTDGDHVGGEVHLGAHIPWIPVVRRIYAGYSTFDSRNGSNPTTRVEIWHAGIGIEL